MVLLLVPVLVASQDEALFDYHALDLEMLITNRFELVASSSGFYANSVSALISWYPRDDYRQEAEYISTVPEADFEDGKGFFFEWQKPSKTSFLIEQSSRIKAKNEIQKITGKVEFPIEELDPYYSDYLVPMEIIDINDDIRSLASSLAKGEDDLYGVVFNLALWVQENVEYDLSTITADASQKASWVLKNRKGVCDEITSLFISLCRSLGIPARFVTGISYSNVNLQNDGWGPHGWAEVYFPGYGWVPFDVTYKELGYLDAAHIKLKDSLDAKEVSVNYSATGSNLEIKPGLLNASVTVLSHDYLVRPLLGLSAEVVVPETGFGSYNLLIVTVKNPNNYYLATKVALANVKELDIDGSPFKQLLLKPNSEQKVYWLLRVGSRLDSRFIYTFPLRITGERGEQAETRFKAERDGKLYSENYMKLFIEEEQAEQKPYSDFLILNCSASKSKLFLDRPVTINCSIKNMGDRTLRNLEVCLGNDCVSSMLAAGALANYTYSRRFDTIGVKNLVFSAENELVESSYYMVLESQDRPLLEIINITYPKSLSYDAQSQIRFFLKKKSTNAPKNVVVRLQHDFFEERWEIGELSQDYDFTVAIRGDNFRLGQNRFNITASYDDEEGHEYRMREEVFITLDNPTFWQKIMVWLNGLEHKINNWF